MNLTIVIFAMIGGILMFVSNIVAYSLGIKHGRVVKAGGVPEINPVKLYNKKQEEKAKKEEFDKFSEGLSNILNFGEPFERGVKRG